MQEVLVRKLQGDLRKQLDDPALSKDEMHKIPFKDSLNLEEHCDNFDLIKLYLMKAYMTEFFTVTKIALITL